MKHITVYKWLSVMLVVLIMAAAIGCGKKEAQKATPTPTATSTPTATAPAEPTGQTGTLATVTGDVQVLRHGAAAWIAATSGMKLGTGDSLKTGSDGYVLITFFDGSVMEVEADSEISVQELSVASGGSTTVRISQVLGNTINRVENLVDSSSTYEVETLAGSAVVRGTIFGMQVDQYGEFTYTCANTSKEDDNKSHSVDFSGSGSTVKVPEGMTSCCWEGGVPGSPFPTDPADDPLQFSSGDGGGGSQCPPGCYPIQGRFIQGEGDGLFGAYVIEDGIEGCYCPPQCQEIGYSCEGDSDCCSGNCFNMYCDKSCAGYDESCGTTDDCCSPYICISEHCSGG